MHRAPEVCIDTMCCQWCGPGGVPECALTAHTATALTGLLWRSLPMIRALKTPRIHVDTIDWSCLGLPSRWSGDNCGVLCTFIEIGVLMVLMAEPELPQLSPAVTPLDISSRKLEMLSQWTWVCVSPGSWRWTGRPGVLQSMVSQSWALLSDWTELSWTTKEKVIGNEIYRLITRPYFAHVLRVFLIVRIFN